MEKTIKERAEDYSMYDNGIDKSMFEAYMDGAIDQRKRDVEKACDWIEENLFTVNENGEYKYVAKNIYGSPYIKKDLFRDFCKAMEDEQ